MPLLLSLAIGAVIQFLVPVPASVTRQAWSLLALFVATIAGEFFSKRAAADVLVSVWRLLQNKAL